MNALDPIVRGIAASAFGTLAMDLSLYRADRHDGGNAAFPGWGSSKDLVSWETLRKDFSAHLVFGTATAAAFRLLPRGPEKGQTQS